TAGATFTAPLLTNIDGTDLNVSGGVTVSLPGVTQYQHASTGNYVDRTWHVDGVDSRLELPNLKGVLGGSHYDTDMTIRATGGGVLDLSSVTQLIDPRGGDTRVRSFQVTAEGESSQIDLSALTSIIDRNTDQRSRIDATAGGRLVAPLLTDLHGVTTTLDTAGDLAAANLVRLEHSAVTIHSMPSDFTSLQSISRTELSLNNTNASLPGITRFVFNTLTTDAGATIQLPAVTTIDGTAFRVYGGTEVSLPGIESYDLALSSNYEQSTWEISGSGSKLDLSGVKWIRGGSAYQNRLNVTVSNGGSLDLSGVEQIVDRPDGDTRTRRFGFTATGSGSEIALDSLVNLIDVNGDVRSFLTETSDGRIFAPSIVTLVNADVNGDVANSPIATAEQPIIAAAPVIENNDIVAHAELPMAPAESPSAQAAPVSWIGGDGDWTTAANWSTGQVPDAEDDVILDNAAVTVTISVGGQAVRSINGSGNLQITGGSLTIHDGSVLSGSLVVNNGATLAASGPDASFTADGTVNLDGASLTVVGGAALHFPTLTQYSQGSTANYQTRRWFVEDSGSRIVFDALQTITGGTHYQARLGIDVFGGGQIEMPALVTIEDPNSGDLRLRRINLVANGHGSLIDAPLLTSINDRSSEFDGEYSSIEARDRGTINTPSLQTLVGVRVVREAQSRVTLQNVTSLDRVDVEPWTSTLDLSAVATATSVRLTATGSSVDFSSLTSFTRGSITLHHLAAISAPLLTNIDGTSLFAGDGSSISLPLVTTYDHASTGHYQDRTWTTDGPQSLIALTGLTAITGGGHYDTDLTISATAGSTIDLPAVTQINDGGGDTRVRRVRFVASGFGSEIRLDALTSFSDANPDERSQLVAYDWGTIHAPSIESLVGVEISLDGRGAMQTANIQSVNHAYLNLSFGDYDFSGLTAAANTTITLNQATADLSALTELNRGAINLRGGLAIDWSHFTKIDGVSLSVFDGGSLDLSGVTEYDFIATGNYEDRAWTTRGAGSSIDLSGLTKITGGTFYDNDLTIESHVGGRIDLRGVTEIVDGLSGDTRRRAIHVVARDRDSSIDLRSLSRFQDSSGSSSSDGQRSQLVFSRGGEIRLDALQTLIGVRIEPDERRDWTFDGVTTLSASEVAAKGNTVRFPNLLTASYTSFVANDATIDAPNITEFTQGTINLSADGSANLVSLTNLDGSGVTVSSGIEVEFPLVTAYSHVSTGNYQTRQFIASGDGSRISLPNLTEITGGTHYEATLRFEAQDGGAIELPKLATVTDPSSGDTRRRAVHFIADGRASRIDVSMLTTLTDVGQPPVPYSGDKVYSTLTATRGGEVDAGALTTIRGVRVYVDELGTFPAPALESARDSVIEPVGAGTIELNALTDAPGTALRIHGYQVASPALTTLQRGEITLTGGGHVALPLLSNIDGANLIVIDGVTLALPAVTSITHVTTGSSQSQVLRAEGYGSVIDLQNVTQITGGNNYNSLLLLESLSGGVIDLSGTQTITETSQGDQRRRRVELLSEGIGSSINLSGLQSFTDPSAGSLSGDARYSRIHSRYGGAVDLGSSNSASLTDLSGVYVTTSSNSVVGGQFTLEPGSVLTGNGVVVGDLIVGGLLAPAGKLTIDGNLLLDTLGDLEFDIAGLAPISQHDVLEVTGFVEFLGTIRTVQGGGYQPAEGDSYLVMTFDGKFGTPTYEGLDFGSQLLAPELSPTSLEFITGFSSGAAITSITPSDSAVYPNGPFLIIEFDEPIDPESFFVDDVTLIGPGAVPINIDSIEPFAETDNLFLLRPDFAQYVDGQYSITIGPDVLDFVGNVMNQDKDQINGEPIEDQFTGTFDWALPDLELVGGNLTTPETTYSFGGDIPVSFQVTNSGASVAGGNAWRDRVYLSTDLILDGNDVLLESVSRDDPLAVGDSYPLDLTLTLPLDDNLLAGTYYLLAAVDYFDWISESDENNVYASAALELTFPPLVDLLPTSITGPTAGQPRQSNVFTWEVTNQGDEPTATHWYDRVYLESVSNPATRYLIGTVLQSGPLSPGQSYVSMMTTNLPDLADGDYRIQIVSDYNNRIFEGPYENNNSLYGGITTMTHPDVEIRNFDAPAAGNSGQQVELTWDFLNSGTAAAETWQQRVYLSDNQTLSGDDRLVDEFIISAPLDPGQARSESRTIRLPVDLEGNKFLLLVTDTAGQLGELSAGENNNVAAKL
ncbi:CARDB domain-containing protein, partial [Stieleria sp.]|uniref:CARDB domain-containing protein n=1 Tax=Stieleria sp. TaxID=2795976 RepID=UPI0035672E6E